jgi:hypothetical protein
LIDLKLLGVGNVNQFKMAWLVSENVGDVSVSVDEYDIYNEQIANDHSSYYFWIEIYFESLEFYRATIEYGYTYLINLPLVIQN